MMESSRRITKAFLYALCFALAMLCTSHLSQHDGTQGYIFGAKAAPENEEKPEEAAVTGQEGDSNANLAVANSTEASNSTSPVPVEDDDLFEADVNCTAVPPYDEAELFGQEQLNKSAVYLKPADTPVGGAFEKMGFQKCISIFGFHVCATGAVSNEYHVHAAKIVARYLDNDQDGKPDRPGALEKTRDYNVIVGYLLGPDESETLWVEKFRDSKHEDFRNIFFCHIHFFEQWQADANIDFHTLRLAQAVAGNGTSTDKCNELGKANFDWPLWYFLFTISYYGYLEDFNNSTNAVIKTAMESAKKKGLFNGNYPDDEEMERADFFAWAELTRLGALECHCGAEVISDVWKPCTVEDLKEFDPAFVKFLDELPGMPKLLPDGTYSSPAVAETAP